jgi:hypothetical protein
MADEYAWLLPVCAVAAAVVLLIDLTIKNAIVAEANELRRVIQDERRTQSDMGNDPVSTVRANGAGRSDVE